MRRFIASAVLAVVVVGAVHAIDAYSRELFREVANDSCRYVGGAPDHDDPDCHGLFPTGMDVIAAHVEMLRREREQAITRVR